MSKLVSIAFSFLILFQSVNISFEDFARFGVLLEHAEYHQEQYGDSFFEFLAEHYGDAEFHPASEHKEHEELPFKEHHNTCVHSATVFTLTVQDYQIAYPSFIEIPFNFFYQDSISLFEKPAVFQPPKHA
ncbi:hypothetical protein BZARG_494 [Bizionia argentinensis JUB59]|uniref:Uncharacterized protein n=1 Tax=Bizionia argentinensis JUB59 TaxID=1046627 RepID=G2EHA7_9FLAO|nr:hypothetical protein [Bizionia argentinensis]EGV42216.1 hypothetical protein BZARG_494 [Bizionia argentinensis JUB59]